MTPRIRWFVLATLVWCLAGAGVARAEEPPSAEAVEQAFAQLKTWEDGQPRRPLALLELAVARSTGDPERQGAMARRLASLLADPGTTDAARRFIAAQLPLVASDAQVPLLATMLDDAKAAETARCVLERIPGEKSVEALRAALGKATGPARIGLINSLGVRRDAASAAALSKMLTDADAACAAAAVGALGRIGTAEAAAALTGFQAPEALVGAVRHALLVCAEGLAARGKADEAAAICRQMVEGDGPPPMRMAALTGLARVAPADALPRVLKALASEDGFIRGTAAGLSREMAGPDVTAALVAVLGSARAETQVAILEVLASRGDRAAAGAAADLMESKDLAVRAAAVAAMAKLGDASCVERLARLAATEQGAVRQAAQAALERLTGLDVDQAIVRGADEGEPAVRVELLSAAAARRSGGAAAVLLKASADADEGVRVAALEGLAVLAPCQAYRQLIERLVLAQSTAEAGAAERAVLAAGAKFLRPDDRARPVVAALKDAPGPAKTRLLRVLAAGGGAEALAAVRPYLTDGDAAVRDAAVRALAAWPDDAAALALLALAKEADHPTHRVLAIRGYLRMAAAVKDAAARLSMLQQVRPVAATVDAKRALLSALADVADSGALEVARSFVADQEVSAEAALAVRQIEAALKPKPPSGAAAMPAPDPQRREALKKDLAARAPKGFRLVCYLDCGPDSEDAAKGGPSLRQAGGQVYFWAGSDGPADIRFGTIAYDGREVVFEATGLDPKREYRAGFSWWDYDHDTRAESVWAAPGKGGQARALLEKTKLPSQTGGQKPEEKTVPLPRDLTAGGAVRLLFRTEGGPNAVVSEVWLWESEAESAAPAPQEAARKPAEKRIVIVTGQEYPGHKWQETAPVLAEAIGKDSRMAVEVVEDPKFLASPDLAKFDAVVLHYMNWETPDAGAEARAGLKAFVEGGRRGLVLVHFACGAFQEWPEFRKIAGRVWDPKLRPHDPHGAFRVEMTEVKHPITAGMKPFETVDELYTCLAGEAPIEVLATARSKVDGKDYPMVFVLTYGKGRVFHNVLGHDVKALAAPGVGELYRRGTAWAAGLAPVAP